MGREKRREGERGGWGREENAERSGEGRESERGKERVRGRDRGTIFLPMSNHVDVGVFLVLTSIQSGLRLVKT